MQTKLVAVITKLHYRIFLACCIAVIFFACKNSNKPLEKDVVKAPDQLEVRTTENLKELLSYALDKKGSLNDSVKLSSLKMIESIYQHNNYKVIWSHKDQWKPIADSLFQVVEHAKEYGLFPADYNYSSIASIKNIIQHDSVSRRDAAIWSRADILYTEAYLTIAKHLKLGRLQRDSITVRKDSVFNDDYLFSNLIRLLPITISFHLCITWSHLL